MLILPRKELIIPIYCKFGIKGFMRFYTVNKFSGKIRIDTGFFPNKILDAGRNNMYTQASWLTHCHVGTNNTTPSASDTQLLGFAAQTSTIHENLTGTQGSAPYFGWRRKTFQFAAGLVGGLNLSEAGVGWGTAGSVLVSRALIIDPITQLPTTITPLADELLRMTYELRYYPPLVDVNDSITLNGIDYDTVTRAAEVTSDRWSDDIGSRIGEYSPSVASWAAYDGAIGTILQSPNGVSANNDNHDNANLAYANNSYEIDMQCNVGPTGWVLGSGIRCIRIQTTAGMYQTSFSSNPGGNTIPKTSGYTMQMVWTLGWTEYVP